MVTPFTTESKKLLEIDNVIYKKDTEEYCFIENLSIYTDITGEEKIIATGSALSSILSRRIISHTDKKKLESVIVGMIYYSIIQAENANRNIDNFRIGGDEIKNNPTISVKYKNTELLMAVKELCQEHNVGFKVNYRLVWSEFQFILYEGKERQEVVFSKQFNNVLEQEYFLRTKDYKNTCIIDNDGSTTIINDDNKGLDRREMYTTLDASSAETATAQGGIQLGTHKKIESIDTVINTNSEQFKYLVDWDLGDIVTCINKDWNMSVPKNIVEIEEYYDTTGRNISIVFGDYIPKK